MSEKEKDPEAIKQNISHKPIDYEKLNRLTEDFGKLFTPQQELSAEQAFWLRMSDPTSKPSDALPVKIEAPKELPKISLVNESVKKLKFYLTKFKNMVKIRTTPNARTKCEWGFKHTKAVFNNEIIVFLKSLKDIFNVFDRDLLNEIMEELRLENDQLLQQIMSQDVLLTVMNSISLIGDTVNKDGNRKESCNLEAELLKSQNAFNDLLKTQLQDKDSSICKLKDIIKSLREKSKEENVNYDYGEIKTKNVELENSVAKLSSENERLCETVEQAKAKQSLDYALDFACKHAQRIQELLVYVRDTCPNTINLSAKNVDVTPKNKVKKVRFAKPLTSSSNIKQVKEYIEKDKIGLKPNKNEKRNSYVYDPNPNSFDCPPNSYHPPHPTYETYLYDSYGTNSQFGYDCQPQFSLNYESKPGYNENYNPYPYDSSSFSQLYPCCTRCGGPHETCQCDQLIFDEPYCKHNGGPHMNYQCQPMNQNSYNSNSLSFDQPQPPQSPVIHQPPQELSIQEMEDLKQQYLDELKCLSNLEYHNEIKIAALTENFNGMSIEIQNKEKLLQQEQWAYLSTHPSKRLTSFCYDDDDDEDYTSAITPDEPVLSIEEPDNSLSMRDEHLDTIPATESDEFIKSGVENLIPILKDQFEDLSESNEEFSSTDNDSFSFNKIDYVEASPPYSELVSSEVMEIVIPEVRGIEASNDNPFPFYDPIISGTPPNLTPSGDNDFFLEVDAFLAVEDEPTSSQFPKSYLDPKGDMLLLEAFLNDDHSSDFKTKSSSTYLNSLLEETNTFDNSLLEFETFCFDVEEISSGSTTTPLDISLSEYEVFHDDHVKEISSGSPTTHSDSPLYASFIFDLSINPLPPADRSDFYEFTNELIPFISPQEYDCFLFKVEPNSRDFTKDVVEDISPTKELQVLNTLPTHPTL
nr:hypothetical protein [Tanacetum cinerariifolium]